MLKGRNTFRAFKNRNYRLFFIGQGISRIGMWMQRTAVLWVIYSMTQSTFMLGLTMFAEQFPSFLFSLYGGVIADRYNRYKIMLITQVASMIQAILLAVLVYSGHYLVWQILTLSVVLGIINAFDVPARQPLVHEMINNKEDLPNALAFNSSLVNLARLVGPALSGIILERWGAGNSFMLNAVSFIAVIVCLLMMKLSTVKPAARNKKAITELKEGLVYLRRTSSIAVIIIMLAVISFFVLPYQTLMPVFAKVVFSGNAATFGYISSFIGCGAIIGALFLASLKKKTNLKIILFINVIILGGALIIFSFVQNFQLAMFFAVVIGFGAMSQTTICMTIIQMNTDEHMRGRVMGFVSMAFFGMLPLGSLLIGAVSAQIGAPYTILSQGIIAIIIAIFFYSFLVKNKLIFTTRIFKGNDMDKKVISDY